MNIFVKYTREITLCPYWGLHNLNRNEKKKHNIKRTNAYIMTVS